MRVPHSVVDEVHARILSGPDTKTKLWLQNYLAAKYGPKPEPPKMPDRVKVERMQARPADDRPKGPQAIDWTSENLALREPGMEG